MINILNIILEKVPKNINVDDIKNKILKVENVEDIHHIHVWTMDGNHNYLTAHIKINENIQIEELEKIKETIKDIMKHINIFHSTLEFESKKCHEESCDNVEINHIHNHSH